MSVSSGVVDGRVGTIIGVSISQFLTRNEAILHSTFANFTTLTGSGNLTVSGTLQSPLTSLLSVSSNTIDGRVGTIIGVSIPQFLTRNETILPSTFQYYNKGSVGKTTGYGNHATLENFRRKRGPKRSIKLLCLLLIILKIAFISQHQN